MANTLEEELALLRKMKPVYEPAIDHRTDRQRMRSDGSLDTRPTTYTAAQLDAGIARGDYIERCECPFCRSCMYLLSNRRQQELQRRADEQRAAAREQHPERRQRSLDSWQHYMSQAVSTAYSTWAQTFGVDAGSWQLVDEPETPATQQMGEPQTRPVFANVEWDRLAPPPMDQDGRRLVDAARQEMIEAGRQFQQLQAEAVEASRAMQEQLNDVACDPAPAPSDEELVTQQVTNIGRNEFSAAIWQMAEHLGIPEGGQIELEWTDFTDGIAHICQHITPTEANNRDNNVPEPTLCGLRELTVRDGYSNLDHCLRCNRLTSPPPVLYGTHRMRTMEGRNIAQIPEPGILMAPCTPPAGSPWSGRVVNTMGSVPPHQQTGSRWADGAQQSHYIPHGASQPLCQYRFHPNYQPVFGNTMLPPCETCTHERERLRNEW